ncbi:MAG TPA: response regulator transcription factor [Bryobacteraceae bacterium]|nr:response regulator transcription factor [Bryobacteraceae bacterium]
MNLSRILLIEDDPGVAVTISSLLGREGYTVETEPDGEVGLARALDRAWALVIVNAILPRKTGFHICCDLRQAGVDTAILMLTARSLVMDRVTGLKLGADDCLAIPFDPSELLARVEALLRRVEKENRILVRTFQFDDVEMDFERAKVRKAGQPVNLASKELQLLCYLVQNRDRVLPREEILQKVWQYNSHVSSRTLDVHISWLRQKLDNPENPQHIQTIRGKGYRFTA